jgi:hypothetical protein
VSPAARDLLARTRAEQGLPAALEDDAACERVAMLLRRPVNANGADPEIGAVATAPRPRPSRGPRNRRG